MNPALHPSASAVAAHLALVLILCVLFTRAVRDSGLRTGMARELVLQRTLLFGGSLAVWLGLCYGLALSGWLLHPEHVPPRAVFLLAPGAVICAGLALSPFGRTLLDGLPLTWLVGYQVFRIAVELVLWLLYREGVLPEQMTFEGANLDVVSGVSALFVAGLLARGMQSRWLVWVWNCGALLLLVNIVVIAVRSMPGPWRAYTTEPANTIVLGGVFVWIPAFYVLAAWFGHVLVFRALLRRPAESPQA
jgi:hypothetical protein